MAIDLSNNKTIFEALKKHIGHELQCVAYGPAGDQLEDTSNNDIQGISVECIDCGEVLLSADAE